MSQTIDLINFPFGEDVTQWPKLTCTQPGHLDLQDAGLRLPGSRDILFQDNGQIRSGDDTHRLVFDRAGGLLELHEAGAIRLLTGRPTPTERMRLLATGEVGIGTAAPTSPLHVTGEIRTDGGLRVAGQAVVGGTLTVESTVGIGTATPTQTLEVVGTVKATAFQGNGAELTGVSGTDNTKVAKAGDTMTGALAISTPGTGLSVTSNAAVGGTLTVGSNVGIGAISPGQALDVVGQGLFRSAPWAGAVPGVAGTVIGFDPNNANGTGFLWSHTTTGVATRLWMDGNPIIFAPAGAERMRVDSGGNVGIGTTTPKAKLHVVADIVAGSDVNGQKFIFHTRTNGGGDFLHITGDDANGNWQWNKGISFVRATGNVGIGTTQSRYTLEVNGSAGMPGGGAWTNSSDLRLKRDVTPLQGALHKLLNLRGVSYRWQEPAKHGNLTGDQMGFVAQEVEAVFPEWVSTNPDGLKDLTIRGLEALVVEAFRELNNKIEALERKRET